ncbi:ORF303 [White spot syndrome virus]|uniref:ORF303 n=1 Tax=White spot syndrome virus TaxID=342409 RepID=A0A2D3I6P6_9VIRU|nr:ORF303 [White spot syndrome virus]
MPLFSPTPPSTIRLRTYLRLCVLFSTTSLFRRFSTILVYMSDLQLLLMSLCCPEKFPGKLILKVL